MVQHGEMRNYVLKTELKMDASHTVKEQSCWVLTWLHASYLHELKILKSWSSNSVIKKEEKTKQKRGGSGVGDIIKMTWNMESVDKS